MKESKELLAYCGLYCGDCGAFTSEITEAAIKLKKNSVNISLRIQQDIFFLKN